ncbi:hypothetical protein JCM8547_005150 [Rhodosporidiobolus lusitaniae]
MLPPLLLLPFALLFSAEAAVLPLRPAQVQQKDWVTPRFSGLVQEIRKSGQGEVVWKAVASRPGAGAAMDGVKAAKLGKSKSAALELEYEWFVENTDQPGVFSITSGAAPSSCLSASYHQPLGHPNPLDVQEQRAFSPASVSSSSCAPSHSFRLLCLSSDPHEDSASSCLVQSVSKGLCVELLPPGVGGAGKEGRDRVHLGWGECEVGDGSGKEGKGWKGKEQRDLRRQRQLWDIVPS